MKQAAKLLARLDEIGQAVAATDRCLALLGLGSVGVERERLDNYSDLDFFVITRQGEASTLINDLGWLTQIHPVTYYFRNSEHGYKLLYADNLFCEFAIFDVDELDGLAFAPGVLVWKHAEFEPELLRPTTGRSPIPLHDLNWQIGECLTNLYVGLGRYCRGEKLSAFRFIQNYAIDRVIALSSLMMQPVSGSEDIYMPERRFEQRFPALKVELPQLMPGYEATPEAAGAILDFLEQHFTINPGMSLSIRNLIEEATLE